MRLPRVRIGTLMLLVAIVALAVSPNAQRRKAVPAPSAEEDRRVERPGRIEQIGGPLAIGVIPGERPEPSPLLSEESLNGPCISFTSDGAALVIADSGGGLRSLVWDVGPRRLRVPGRPPLTEAVWRRSAFTPDGRLVAYRDYPIRGSRRVRIADLTAGAIAATHVLPDLMPRYAQAFSPDGATLALGGADREVSLIDVAKGSRSATYAIREPAEVINHLRFSPDGKLIAVGGTWESVVLLDAGTGAERRRFSRPRRDEDRQLMHLDCLEFSPDGRLLAEVRCDEILVREVATGREVFRHQPPPAFRSQQWVAGFTPAGDHIVMASSGGEAKLLDVPGGNVLRTLYLRSKRIALELTFSPDRRLLAGPVVGGSVVVWDLAKLFDP